MSKEKIEDLITSKKVKHIVIEHNAFNSELTKGNYVSKYIVDIVIETVVTEHRFYSDKEGILVIPNEFKTDVQYGSNLKSISSTLVTQGIVASKRVKDMLAAFSGGILEISDGSIYNFLNELYGKGEYLEKMITEKLLNNTIMYVDETGSRCEKKNICFRNYSNEELVLFTANYTKGRIAVEQDNILPLFSGTLIHDHNTLNYNYGLAHGECGVHGDRYLKCDYDNTSSEWSMRLRTLIHTINNSKKIAILYGATCFHENDLARYSESFDFILKLGYRELKEIKSKYYRDETRKLLNRYTKYKENYLLFAYDFKVPFDNNLSERDLRMIKTKTKVSGCFRSIQGAKIFARIMSIIKSCTKQGMIPFDMIKKIYELTPVII